MEETKGAAVSVIGNDDVFTGFDQPQRGIDRCHSRGESIAIFSAFESCKIAFNRKSCGVGSPRVLESLVPAQTFLGISRRLIDRYSDRARRLIGLIAGVNRSSRKA